MSVHFISGKPGGGKSLYGMRLIIDELVHGNRPVITNVPINLGRLSEYLQDKYPKAYERITENGLVHISEKVICLSEDDLPKFFCYRGNDVKLDWVDDLQWKSGVRPDFSKISDAGVFYVLDEVHIAFNARAWAETGRAVLYYLSQHRKLGDDVVCITQHIGNVDKQFRSVAQDYTYIKNLSKQKVGVFRLPTTFIRSTYSQPATDNSTAQESGTFTLDVSGIASCYDTAKGVGIHGRSGADVGHRAKGVHWLWAVVGGPVVGWLIWHYGTVGLVHVFSPHSSSPPAKRADAIPAPQSSLVQTAKVSLSTPAVGFSSRGQDSQDTDLTYCTGVFTLGRHLKVFLSDGTVGDTDAGDDVSVFRSTVSVNGKVYERHANYQPSQPVQGIYPVSVSQGGSSIVHESDQPFLSDQPLPQQPYSSVQVIPFGRSYSETRQPRFPSGFASMNASRSSLQQPLQPSGANSYP